MTLRSRAAVFLAVCTLLPGLQKTLPEVSIDTQPYTPPSTILRAETNLVETDLTVRDANGHAVPGLQSSDFEVFDNGVPQTIAAFSEVRKDAKAESTRAAPKFVTFFFDNLHMGRPGPSGQFALPFLQQAARDFAAEYLKPGDHISVATTTGGGALDFTDDPKLFAEKVYRITYRWPYQQESDTMVAIGRSAEYHQDAVNALAAAVSAVGRLAQIPGERTLVFLSRGFICHIETQNGVFDCEPELHALIDSAVRGNVSVQAIDAKGLSAGPFREVQALRRPLKELSDGTGGHLFENSNDLAGAMELAAHPEVTYQLAFNPGSPDGKFHRLRIRFKTKRNASLEFRPGYLSRKDEDSEKKLAARRPMDDAVFSKQTLNDVAAAVNLVGGLPKDGTIPVSIDITLDVNRLQFRIANGRHMQQIVFLTALLDASGNYVTGKESIMDLALTDEKLASLRKDGLKAIATLEAPPGIYQVRTVVREGMKGGLAASTTVVELRAR
jgi:VWFA-related protein